MRKEVKHLAEKINIIRQVKEENLLGNLAADHHLQRRNRRIEEKGVAR